MAKRPYKTGKTASLPGGRITEKFQADLKNWAEQLGISQVQLIERSFYNYTLDYHNFIHCPHCDASIAPADYQLPNGVLQGTCTVCNKDYTMILEK
jgi:hypothetical protein